MRFGFAAMASLLLAGAIFPLVAAADPTLDAHLLDDAIHAQVSSAVVEVSVSGVDLVEPDEAGPKPKSGEAHLQYRLDGGPVIATTARKLAFRELAPGAHRITVTLAGNDHQPIGPERTLETLIPSAVLAH